MQETAGDIWVDCYSTFILFILLFLSFWLLLLWLNFGCLSEAHLFFSLCGFFLMDKHPWEVVCEVRRGGVSLLCGFCQTCTYESAGRESLVSFCYFLHLWVCSILYISVGSKCPGQTCGKNSGSGIIFNIIFLHLKLLKQCSSFQLESCLRCLIWWCRGRMRRV